MICPTCGATVPEVPPGSPTHAYVGAPAACWAAFGRLQADEMARFGYPAPAHRLVVDAYMASHPGDGADRRDRQSVFVHLRALGARFAQGRTEEQVSAQMRRAPVPRPHYPLLTPPPHRAGLNLNSMEGAPDLSTYTARAWAWASSVWDSWSHQHSRILTWQTSDRPSQGTA